MSVDHQQSQGTPLREDTAKEDKSDDLQVEKGPGAFAPLPM